MIGLLLSFQSLITSSVKANVKQALPLHPEPSLCNIRKLLLHWFVWLFDYCLHWHWVVSIRRVGNVCLAHQCTTSTSLQCLHKGCIASWMNKWVIQQRKCFHSFIQSANIYWLPTLYSTNELRESTRWEQRCLGQDPREHFRPQKSFCT